MELAPAAIERMVALLLRERADVVVPWLTEYRNLDETAVGKQDDAEEWTVALAGAAPPLERMAEVFGPGAGLIRRSCFTRIGGYQMLGNGFEFGLSFVEDHSPGAALILRAHALGFAVSVLPEVAYTQPVPTAAATTPGLEHQRDALLASAAMSSIGWQERILLEYTLGRQSKLVGEQAPFSPPR